MSFLTITVGHLISIAHLLTLQHRLAVETSLLVLFCCFFGKRVTIVMPQQT